MNKKLAVAEHLTDKEYQLFLNVYANHNRAMGMEKRKDYTLSHIVRVKRNLNENCLEVHYENGDWWNYYGNGTWG